MSSRFVSVVLSVILFNLYHIDVHGIGMSEAALSSGNPTMSSAPVQSTPIPAEGLEALSRAASIQQSIDNMEATFSASERGPYEIDSETGAVTFTYQNGNSIVTAVCQNGQCGSAMGSSVDCFENQVPDLATGSCQCAPGYRASRMDGSGGCVAMCPPGSTMRGGRGGTAETSMGCVCSSDSSIPVVNGDVSVCDAMENAGEDCEALKIRGQDTDESRACEQRNRQAEIERQRLENEAQAQAMAKAAADEDLASNIETVRTGAISSCESQTQAFISQCRTVAAQVPPNENISPNQAGSAEQCRSLQRSSESVVSQVESQVDGCVRRYESLTSSCPQTTGQQNGSGSATVDTGAGTYGSAVVASADETSSGAGGIPENGQMVAQAQSVFSDLTNLSSQVASEMRDLERQAQECIAAFEQDPDNSRGNNFAGLAQTAAQAFGSLDKAGGAAGGYGEMGAGGSAATSPGYQGTGSGYSNGLTDAGGPTGFNGGGGDFDGSVGGGANPSGVPGGRGPASARGGASGSMMGGMGMSIGSGVGRGGPSGGAGVGTASNGRGRSRFAKASERNLHLGYKKVNKDGQSVTYHPNDLKKIGKKAMLAKLEEAKKKFGKDTPLLFKNGKFMRDYLEMKNRLAWKKHNLKQKNRMSGIFNSKKEQEAKAFHQCAIFGECYTEARYNIFKLHHFKALKHIGK